MQREFFPSLRAGMRHIKENPQLWWTVFVALIILVAFWFMATQFIGIARDAQERLIAVRVGSIQDAYVAFVPEHLDDASFLRKTVLTITQANPTIQDFKVTRQNESGDQEIIASINSQEVGSILDSRYSFLTLLAKGDPESSFTVPVNGSERMSHTMRAYETDSEVGFILTTQTLSEADRLIDENLQKAIIIFIAIVIVVILLFLRHARIIDYVSLYKKLQEVNTLKDDFISMASHELRTPLTAIRGYAEFLLDDPNVEGESREHVTRIDTSAKQLDGLVADMLDVSRIEQGRMKFEYATVDPRTVTQEVVESLRIPAKDKGLTLTLDIEKSGAINVDQNRLKQVLVNIVGNAVKYTLKGEVKVRVYQEGTQQVIRISDTGIGMSAEAQKNLFQKFYRIQSEETAGIRGTGLGLWITKQIIETMQGKISVESIKGVGTHFIVSFPLVK